MATHYSATLMASFLPRRPVPIIRTPEYRISADTSVPAEEARVEIVELLPIDIINAFLALQEEAMRNARRLDDSTRRAKALHAIRSMVYF